MFLVGLTGGIATGKSSVTSLLRNMGVEIIDADVIAREVVEPGKKAWKRLRKEFGDAIFHNDGTLDRKALAQIIFSEPEKRRIVNSITHPEIYKSMFWRCVKLFFTGHQFAVVDVPLLYESAKMVKYLHKTIVVVCSPTQQLERLMARDKLSEHEALARIKAQIPVEEKAKRADFVILNDSDKNYTKVQVQNVVKQLQQLKTHWKFRILAFASFLIPVAIISAGTVYWYKH